MQDPYSILGVSRDASDEDIKKAYRKLSRIYHPDANINNPNKDQAEAKFKEIQQAYQQINGISSSEDSVASATIWLRRSTARTRASSSRNEYGLVM